jgi:hypothetical protein
MTAIFAAIRAPHPIVSPGCEAHLLPAPARDRLATADHQAYAQTLRAANIALRKRFPDLAEQLDDDQSSRRKSPPRRGE